MTSKTEQERVGLLRPRKPLNRSGQRVRNWILAHRGKLREIADLASVSHQFVHQIAYRKADTASAGLRVERLLAEAGCPGVWSRRTD